MNSIAENPEIMKLRAEIEQFISARNMSRTGFGKWAANDPSLMKDIEEGRELRWSTIRTIREKMAGAS